MILALESIWNGGHFGHSYYRTGTSLGGVFLAERVPPDATEAVRGWKDGNLFHFADRLASADEKCNCLGK